MIYSKASRFVISCLSLAFALCASGQSPHRDNAPAKHKRSLSVVLYPFIPNFQGAAVYVKRTFEAENPDVELTVLDLRSNYYDSAAPNYIGTVEADVYELDSILLRDFVQKKKIVELPQEALLPSGDLLSNSDVGTRLDGKRYGAAHWVCRDLLFYRKGTAPVTPIKTLSELAAFLGPKPSLVIDMRGRSTLGEYYLVAAMDRYEGDWAKIFGDHLKAIDPAVEDDVKTLASLCDPTSCRSKVLHDFTGTHGDEFGRGQGRALLGYSESLFDVLNTMTAQCADPARCTPDQQLAVGDLPLDEKGSTPMTWVDSFTLNEKCVKACAADAVRFIRMMNRDDVYLQLLLPSTPYLTVPQPGNVIPTYLLPAKASLYSNPQLLKAAHLYTDLRPLIENSKVPTDVGLNDALRKIGSTIDGDIK